MDAFVSGQCGRAICVQGTEAFLVSVDETDTTVSIPLGLAYTALAGATDIRELKGITRERLNDVLQLQWSCDRALRLMLILLDEDEYIEVRQEASEIIEEFLSDIEVCSFVSARLYSKPLPSSFDVAP